MRSARHRLLQIIVVFGLASSASQIAHARDQDRDPDKAEAKAKVAESIKYFEQGTNAYRVGDFDGAAAALRRAYELNPEPLLLYNLGRALEGANDLAGAVHTYRQYLSTAGRIKDRRELEAHIDELEKQLKEKQSLEIEGRPNPAEQPSPVAVIRPRRSFLPWIVAGAGGAVFASGGVFGLMANSRHNDAENAPNQAAAHQLQQDAKGLATLSNVLLVTGGVIAASSIVWAIVDGGGSSSPERITRDAIAVNPVVGLGWIGLQGRF